MRITLVGESGRKIAGVTGKFYRKKKIGRQTRKHEVLKFFTRFGNGQERMATI
jgi:hypothetical protein